MSVVWGDSERIDSETDNVMYSDREKESTVQGQIHVHVESVSAHTIRNGKKMLSIH